MRPHPVGPFPRHFGAILLMGGAVACADPPPTVSPSTQRMVDRLREHAEQVDPTRYAYANAEHVAVMLEAGPPADARSRLEYRFALAEQTLFAGRPAESVALATALSAAVDSLPPRDLPPGFARRVRQLLAVSNLRLSKYDNCLGEGRAAACLFPITPEFAHTVGPGAAEAVRLYTELLSETPDDGGLRWLLNLAHMMRGDYPDGVPTAWRIDPAAFTSEDDLGRFPDVAPALGLDRLGRLGGVILDDFDGDDDVDVLVSAWGLRDQLRYFQNDGDGGFTDRTTEAGLAGIVGGINLIQADIDNDGCLDALVIRGAWSRDGFPNSLLRNRCDGSFDDITYDAGMGQEHPTLSAAWGDFDNDGWIDLFVANESRGPIHHRSQLFRNNGDGTFTDVAPETGAAVVGYNKGATWGDVDDDGRPDLFVSRLGEPNILLRNAGPDSNAIWKFRDVTRDAGVAEPRESFPTWFWDFDNDGRLDLFVSGYGMELGDVTAEYLGQPHTAQLSRLYRNVGDGRFEDVSVERRLDRILFSMGANFGDLDNDGWLDLYMGTGDAFFQAILPNRMFRNDGSRQFREVTASGGFGHLMKGHGIGFADLDNDGDQDVYAQMGGAYSGDIARDVVFENPGHGASWLTLLLEGTTTNRAAIGARVRVVVATPAGSREIHRLVSSGGTFGSNSLRLEIGLGDATAVEALDVRWPGGAAEVFTPPGLNGAYRLREGTGTPAAVPLPAIRLGSAR
jgi:hypothetical protein